MATRSLTISWDASTNRQTVQHMSGREYIEATMSGKIQASPMSRLMGFVTTEIGDGSIVVECMPGEQHYNVLGSTHGGLASTLLDTCMGGAVQVTMPAGYGAATLELKINYVRAITVETGKLRCEGRVIHPGKRIATADGRITDASGRLYAHGSTTMMIFPIQEMS